MPGQSRSRDRHGGRERARDPERKRERERRRERHRESDQDRDRERERDYIRGRYEEEGEGAVSSPDTPRGKYRFRGESGYDSYGTPERDGNDYEARRRRERRERRRLREEERAYQEVVGERKRERSKGKESPATSPIKKQDRERDRDGRRRRRDLDEDGERCPSKDVRERRYRTRGGDESERERSRDVDAEARRRGRRVREREKERERERGREVAAAATRRKHQSTESSNSASHLLSADALAKLASEQEQEDRRDRSRGEDEHARRERRRQKKAAMEGAGAANVAHGRSGHRSGARVVSGAYLEEGRSPEMKMRRRGGGGGAFPGHWKKEEKESWDDSVGDGEDRPSWKFWANWSRKKRLWIGGIAAVLLLLLIIIPIAVSQSKKNSSSSAPSSPTPSSPANSNLDGISRDSIPAYARGTVLDPFTWYDTHGFNVTFTNETVGGLSVMGLYSHWDDSARPNDNVPPLNEKFPYGSQPIRGVNLGGWLSIEPFIAPSLFSGYSPEAGVVDEWTLSQALGSTAPYVIEKHYATFVTEQDFAEIKAAGLDHVRIPYSYWAVTTYEGDPYVPKIAWRYLLRAIEYCRKYGLRVKLDLHGAPGSQNGWNHSGHQGKINWLEGPDGDLNGQRSLENHDQLSQFFAQDRYKNIVTIYGLVNEPFMLALPVAKVLDWTRKAAELVRKNGVEATIVLHDGFINLDRWDQMFQPHPSNMYLDTHQYTIFNTGEIVLDHSAKIKTICDRWSPMIQSINSTTSGWGPTICGEWSQADTDCAEYLNNVGRGTRWEGTYEPSSTTAYCPTADNGPPCSCTDANAAVSQYSGAYKQWLRTYAEAQMSAFETAQGWFYWTWRTESAAQWSYRTAWKNGYMPEKAYAPSFKCGDTVPDFSAMGLPEYY